MKFSTAALTVILATNRANSFTPQPSLPGTMNDTFGRTFVIVSQYLILLSVFIRFQLLFKADRRI